MVSEDLSVAELAEITRWVHRVEHLRWVKGLGPVPEGQMVAECWAPGPPPQWAVDAAMAGESGAVWCPLVSPDLLRV